MDPLLDVLLAAADGRFPPADGGVDIFPAPIGGRAAVVAFTAHSIIATDLDADTVRARLTDPDPGTPSSVPFLAWLAGAMGGAVGSLDVVLVATRADDGPALRRVEAPPHARVARARAHRVDVEVHRGAGGGLVTTGRGLAGRLEVSLELEPGLRGHGLGTELARAARRFAAPGDPVFAQVAPGNVASLRAFLRAGYRPIGSEVLITGAG